MAKSIRSIKNTLCDDEKLGALSRDARLLFIGLITRADDHGRFRSHAAVVRGQVFPYDEDLTAADVERLLQDLAAAGRISLYLHEGQRYGHIPKWSAHQRVDNASASDLPDPPAANCGELRPGLDPSNGPADTLPRRAVAVDNGSRSVTNTVENVDAASPSQSAANCGELPLDRRGREGKGTIAADVESTPRQPRSTASAPPRRKDELFDAVCNACGIDASELTKSGRGPLNRSVADLRAVGAAPADVAARAKRWRYDVPLTPPGLAKHWAQLGPPQPTTNRATRPPVYVPPPPATAAERANGLAQLRAITRPPADGAT